MQTQVLWSWTSSATSPCSVGHQIRYCIIQKSLCLGAGTWRHWQKTCVCSGPCRMYSGLPWYRQPSWKNSAVNSSSDMAVMKCLRENRVGVYAECVHPNLNLPSMAKHLLCCSAFLDIMWKWRRSIKNRQDGERNTSPTDTFPCFDG